MDYYEILSLSNFYFEDSYVVSIIEPAGSITFELDAALTENHPQYEKPKQGEQYCYRKVLLRFFNTESVEWRAKKILEFVDSTGDLDYGNIDSFVRSDGAYNLSGDWGSATIRGGEVEAVIMD